MVVTNKNQKREVRKIQFIEYTIHFFRTLQHAKSRYCFWQNCDDKNENNHICIVGEVISVPTFQQYGTAFYGSAISSQPLKSEVIHRNGLKAKVDCANACGEIIDCKVFSISSQTKLCHMFEHTTQLCDANIMEPNTSVHLLLWTASRVLEICLRTFQDVSRQGSRRFIFYEFVTFLII